MKTDADEWREIAAMIKARGPNPNARKVITKKEWKQYERLGYDMSKFIVWQDLLKQERERQAKEYRDKLPRVQRPTDGPSTHTK